MNNSRRNINIFQTGFLLSGMLLFCMAGPAWAEEGAREWRPIYDFIMRWINFGILVYFLVKVVGPILVKFLSNQQIEIRDQIERVEKEKDEMLARVQAAKDSLENSGSKLEEIKNRIIGQGEQKKQEIIAEAKEHSELMLMHARDRIGNRINLARKKFMVELLDMAMEKALEHLPKEITEEDNHRIIEKYLASARTK